MLTSFNKRYHDVTIVLMANPNTHAAEHMASTPEDPRTMRIFVGCLAVTSALTAAAFFAGIEVREGRDPASVERTSFTNYEEERKQVSGDR